MKIYTLNNRKNKGFTLLELMLVIAAAIALIGIGLLIYRQVQSSSTGLSASTSVMQLTSSIKQLYPNPNFTGVNVQTLIDTKKAPEQMVVGNTLVNTWGGQVTIAAANYNGGTNNAVAITVAGVPTDGCNNLIAAVQGSFQVIEVGATKVKDDANSVAFNTNTVAAQCKASNNNSIVLTTT